LFEALRFPAPGCFYDTWERRAEVPQCKRGRQKTHGIPDLAQTAEGCRAFSATAKPAPFADGTPSVNSYRKTHGAGCHKGQETKNPDATLK